MIAQLSPFRLMLYTASVLFILALAYLVLQVKSVVVILVLGVILASAIEPFVYRLRRHGWGRGQAILTIYAFLIVVVVLAFYLMFPPVIRQGAALIDNIPSILSNLRDQALNSDNEFVRETGSATIARIQRLYLNYRETPSIGSGTAVSLVSSAFGLLFTVLTTLIVAFYWLTEKAIIKRLVIGLLAPRYRGRIHGIWDNVEAKLGGWTRGQAILCLAIGLASAVAYSPLFLNLPFWLALALWAGITELIPFIGPWLGGTVATVVALTQSFETAILVVAFVIVLQQLEGAVLVPKVMRNAVGLTPLTVVLAVQVGGAIGGPVGAILAIPVAGAFQVIVQDLLLTRKESLDFGIRGRRLLPQSRELAAARPSAMAGGGDHSGYAVGRSMVAGQVTAEPSRQVMRPERPENTLGDVRPQVSPTD